MALPSVDYTRRDPAAEVLHLVVRDHLQTFLAGAAHLRDGEGVPRLRRRCAGVPTLWRTATPDCAHRVVLRRAADPDAPGPARRRAEADAGARSADRRRRRLAPFVVARQLRRPRPRVFAARSRRRCARAARRVGVGRQLRLAAWSWGANPRVPRQQAAKNGPAVGRPQFDNGDSVIPRPC